MWHNLGTPSKQFASSRPLPNILITWAYSCPSSLKISSRLSLSFSFFPLLRFLPPLPRQGGMVGSLNQLKPILPHRGFIRLATISAYNFHSLSLTHTQISLYLCSSASLTPCCGQTLKRSFIENILKS